MRFYGAPLPHFEGAKTGSALLWGQTRNAPVFGEQIEDNLTLARKFRSESDQAWLFDNLGCIRRTESVPKLTAGCPAYAGHDNPAVITKKQISS